MLSSNMLVPILIPLIDVTFSTPTRYCTQNARRWRTDGANLCYGLFSATTVNWGVATIALMMLRLTAIALIATSVSLANAQETPNKSPTPNWDLHVEIKTDKSVYTRNESIRYQVLLRNSGKTGVYIAKSFYEAGGEIAGFYVSVKQLTGKPSGISCVSTGDWGPTAETRTVEQILREDFLRLAPGGIVGFESQYNGCVVKYPGDYEITATYTANDLKGKVRLLNDEGDPIVSGIFHSKPLTFRVRSQ